MIQGKLKHKQTNRCQRARYKSKLLGFSVIVAFFLSGFGQLNLQGDKDGRGDGYNLWVMNLDGSDLRKLTDGCKAKYPVWSPDGVRIAYITESADPIQDQLTIINVDGIDREMKSVSIDDFYSWVKPGWSPDGDYIAYLGYMIPSHPQIPQVFLLDSDSPDPVKIAQESLYINKATWSPDSTRIAYTTGDLINGEVYTVNIESLEQVLVESGRMVSVLSSLFWIPDGEGLLVAISNRNSYLFSAEGSGIKGLYPSGRNHIASPDRSRIAFETCGSDCQSESEIYVMNVDGSQVLRIVEGDYYLGVTNSVSVPH